MVGFTLYLTFLNALVLHALHTRLQHHTIYLPHSVTLFNHPADSFPNCVCTYRPALPFLFFRTLVFPHLKSFHTTLSYLPISVLLQHLMSCLTSFFTATAGTRHSTATASCEIAQGGPSKYEVRCVLYAVMFLCFPVRTRHGQCIPSMSS